ncbi:MAG: ATP-binding protein [Brevundimonas sp.]|jgi:SpoVK/Ycf46/Vps4 family AAA+-type ATPase|uniref:AAA family ATPase n=1 Tax=Brevundimonas TaxID=41275 RepID=UPI001A21E3E6|nr:ATP-binding protein [Brevundimonas sp.]MBJ7319828.1 ATP-binding protein [Brevundimonas sp.]
MARSDLLISLVRAGAAGDRSMLTSTVEAIVAEEKSRSHHVLADRLERALQSVPVTNSAELRRTGSAAGGRDFVIESEARVELSDLILPLPARRLTEQLVQEQLRSDLLRTQGMQPRHRILLSGPPGNGKTSLAEAIAHAVSLPLLTVRYDALVGAYLGETNARMAKLFEYARSTPCVLFFDEFDAVGKERGDVHETGEIKRVVSFLLMQLDQLPSYVIAMAATNHAELLDRAVWRRFQLRFDMPAPDAAARAVLVSRFMDAWPEPVNLSAEVVAKRLGPISYAEVVEFCQNVRRRHILAQGSESLKQALGDELSLWASRVAPEGHGETNKTSAAAGPADDPRPCAKSRVSKAQKA